MAVKSAYLVDARVVMQRLAVVEEFARLRRTGFLQLTRYYGIPREVALRRWRESTILRDLVRRHFRLARCTKE